MTESRYMFSDGNFSGNLHQPNSSPSTTTLWSVKKNKNHWYDIVLQDTNGNKTNKKFLFENNVGLSNLQQHPVIAQRFKYGVADWYKASLSMQDGWKPHWVQPTQYGDQKQPNRGIERLASGERSKMVADLTQAFSNRYNHEFETIIKEVEKLCLKDTCFSFFFGTTVSPMQEDSWQIRYVRFDRPVFEKGTRKQDYPLITYYEEYDAGTYVTTGYGMSIPIGKLFKNGKGSAGKYSIDKFILAGFNALAMGFRDFYYIYFIELALNMENQYIRYLNRTKKKFETLDQYLEFEETIWGILNPDKRKDGNYKNYPVEHLIKETSDHIKNYNPTFGTSGSGRVGIALDHKIVHGERYKKYNLEDCFVGPKTGTFRNTETLDEGDDVWKTKKMNEAVIFGLGRFKDEKRPDGICPLKQKLRIGYWFEVPDYEDVIDKNSTHLYSSNHHDVQAIEAKTGLPVNFQPIAYEKIINLIDPKILDSLFDRDTLDDNMTLSFGTDFAKDKYMNMLYDIVIQRNWNIISRGEMGFEHIIDDIRYAIREKTHVLGQARAGKVAELNTLPGVKELMILISRIVLFFKDFGFTHVIDQSDDDLTFKIFIYLILAKDEIQALKSDDQFNTIRARYPIINNLFDQIKEVYKNTRRSGLNVFQNIQIDTSEEFRSYVKPDVDANSLKQLFSILFKGIRDINISLIKKFLKWNIPLFFRLVLLRFEELDTWAALFGTEKMAERQDVQPVCKTHFDARLLEAEIQCQNNVAIRFINKEDLCILENVRIDLDKKVNRLNCNLPLDGTTDEWFKVMIFYYKTNLKQIERLYFKGIPSILRYYIEDEGYQQLMATHNFDEISQHLNVEDWLEDEFDEVHEQYEHYIKDKFTKYCQFAYKGGIKRYNPNTKKWDCYERLSGPMGKFYC